MVKGIPFSTSILGLLKSSGALPDSAPTVGLGETRDDLAPAAAEAQTEADEDLSQGEQERKYFAVLAEDAKAKRGGTKKNRKKGKK